MAPHAAAEDAADAEAEGEEAKAMSAPAELAARIAANARAKAQRIAPGHVEPPREWWRVTTPKDAAIDVFMSPPATEREMRAIYPGCRIEPIQP